MDSPSAWNWRASYPEDTVEELAEENIGDYTGVTAYYREEKTGNKKTVTAGDQSKPKRLRWMYASERSEKSGRSRMGADET